MYRTRKRKSRVVFYLKFLIPALVGFVLLIGSIDAYLVYNLTHPRRVVAAKDFNKNAPDEWAKVVPLPWKEISWTANGTTFKGWTLIKGPGAPGILLSHGFGGARDNLLDLGYRLWERGYNVMLYDLRAHGESAVTVSTLGVKETEDLAAALKEFRKVKTRSGGGEAPLIDQERVGLYGVEVGAYASLMVAAADDKVTAVVADMPSPSVPEYVHTRLRQNFGIDSQIANFFVDGGISAYFAGSYDAGSLLDVVRRYKGKQVAVIVADQPKQFRDGAISVFNALNPEERERVDLPQSRVLPIFGKDFADKYNESVTTFFLQKGLKLNSSAANRAAAK